MVVGNVEQLVDGILDALNRHDPEALAALCHPEIEFQSRLLSLEGGTYRGRAGFDRFFTDIAEAFGEARWELMEVIGWRGGQLLVVFRVTGTGRLSGIPFDQPAFQAWAFKDGKPIRNVVYASREELEAAVSD